MKIKIIIIFILTVIFVSNDIKSFHNYHSYKLFYHSLKPYGEWIEIDEGIIAWRPLIVGINWKPYMIGRWCWTKYGWYWDSYEPFGWAVYHYGRWYYDDYYGWIWIPDDQWGPAWVEWRYDEYYIGWAPLPPYAVFRIGIGIHFSVNWHAHYMYWNFVPFRHFCDHHIHHYIIDSKRSYKIFERTRYRNSYTYRENRIINEGIDPLKIEEKAKIRIREYNINDIDDYRKIERVRVKDKDRIYTYRLSNKDYETIKGVNVTELKKVERKSTLQRDKIFREYDADNYGDRTIERTRKENNRTNEFYDIRKREETKKNYIQRRGEQNDIDRKSIDRNYNRSIGTERRNKIENRYKSDNKIIRRVR